MPEHDLSVLPARAEDLPVLRRLGRGPAESWATAVERDRCLVATRNGAVVAAATLNLDRRSLAGPWGERTPPVLARLAEAVERQAARYLLFQLSVRVPRQEAPAWERLGYRPVNHSGSAVMRLQRAFPRRQTRYGRRVGEALDRLGISRQYGIDRDLAVQPECVAPIACGRDCFDRPLRLERRTAEAWRALRQAAAGDDIVIAAVSGYRDLDYQVGIVQRKRERGTDLDDILAVSAAPGFSEHHSGRALDLTTPGADPLETSFEDTPAFAWLQDNAPDHGFRLSYPRDNPHRVAYEPWHWFWVG